MLDFFRLTPKKRTIKIKSEKGVIFSNPDGKKRYVFYGATLIIILSISYLIYLYQPLIGSLITYKTGFNLEVKQQELNNFENRAVAVNEFTLRIPKILAASRVAKDVSPFDKKEYLKVLDNDLVAQAKGTALPGEGKGTTVYLFAHSTRQGVQMVRNNSVFYLLGEMNNSDPIFINYEGKVYTYRVYNKKVVNASEVEYLNYKDESKEILILQTCWPLGTDWKRLLIFAERI